MLSGSRIKGQKNQCEITYEYALNSDVINSKTKLSSANIIESTEMVDGIGGTTWDGAMVLCRVLENVIKICENKQKCDPLSILELGCGTGFCGLVAAQLGAKVILTDRIVDLAQKNADTVEQKALANPLTVLPLTWGKDSPANLELQAIRHYGSADVIIGAEITVLRKQQESLVQSISDLAGPETVVLLTFDDGPPPNDGQYEKNFNKLMADAKFTSAVVHTAAIEWRDNRTNKEGILSGNKDSIGSETVPHQQAFYYDYTDDFPNALGRVSFPSLASTEQSKETLLKHRASKLLSMHFDISDSSNNHRSGAKRSAAKRLPPSWNLTTRPTSDIFTKSPSTHLGDSTPAIAEMKVSESTRNESDKQCDAVEAKEIFFPPLPPSNKQQNENDNSGKHDLKGSSDHKQAASSLSSPSKSLQSDTYVPELLFHHVVAYYRPTAVNTCSRCQKQFFKRKPYLNNANSCRFHKGFFVCRRHPAEVRCSINGFGDGLGYYGNGMEDYDAKFWDCCGSEDPNAPGCTTAEHIGY